MIKNVLKNKISWILISLFIAFACTDQEQRRLPYLGNYDVSYKKVNGKTITDTIYQRIPSFIFLNEDSVEVNNQTYAGKVWISEFFFANCPSICPIMNTQLKNVAKSLAPYHKDIQYLSFTIDPTNDTPSKLKAHKKLLGINSPNWAFLTGNETYTHQLGIEHFLIFAGRQEEALGGYAHSGAFTLVDKKGYVRGVYEVVKPDLSVNKKEFERLIKDTKTLFTYEYQLRPK
jgi:protein SCO1/2